MSRWLVSLSGGLDSCAALALANKLHGAHNIEAVSFLYQQRHMIRETDAAHHVCDFYDIVHRTYAIKLSVPGSALTDPKVQVPDLKDMVGQAQPITYVPFRNLVFASILANYAQANGFDGIVFGFHQSDSYGYWDTTKLFVERLRAIFELDRSGKVLEVEAPFLTKSKADAVKEAHEIGAPLHLTYSCYRGGAVHCGTCATCMERKAAFRQAGVSDMTTYEL